MVEEVELVGSMAGAGLAILQRIKESKNVNLRSLLLFPTFIVSSRGDTGYVSGRKEDFNFTNFHRKNIKRQI